jgi:phosphoglycolate phosphatase-like HAD superfamily hydrolase
MVGDSISDIEFGKRAGMKTAFISGKGEDPSVVEPDFQFENLMEFARFILGKK